MMEDKGTIITINSFKDMYNYLAQLKDIKDFTEKGLDKRGLKNELHKLLAVVNLRHPSLKRVL